MIKGISGQIKAKAALIDPSHYGRSDTSAIGRWFWEIDKVLLLLVSVLIGIGLIAVAAASPAVGAALFGRKRHLQRTLLFLAPARVDRDRHSGDGRDFDDAQGSGATDKPVRRRFLLRPAGICPDLGPEVNGARRWINFGLGQVQPSEFLKPFFVVSWRGF